MGWKAIALVDLALVAQAPDTRLKRLVALIVFRAEKEEAGRIPEDQKPSSATVSLDTRMGLNFVDAPKRRPLASRLSPTMTSAVALFT